MRLMGLVVVLCLLPPTVFAEDEPKPFAFDEVNPAFDDLVARATKEKRRIFIDFYLDG